MLVESANQFSLGELCRTQYSLKYFSKPYRPPNPLRKTLNMFPVSCQEKAFHVIIKLTFYDLKHNFNQSIYGNFIKMWKDKKKKCNTWHIRTGALSPGTWSHFEIFCIKVFATVRRVSNILSFPFGLRLNNKLVILRCLLLKNDLSFLYITSFI